MEWHAAACRQARSIQISVYKFVIGNYLHIENHLTRYLFVIGYAVLSAGITQIGYAQDGETFLRPEANLTQIEWAICQLYALVEGAFGALVMVIAGLGAIISAAMGQYRTAVSALVVAVGAFILRSVVSLFFGDSFQCIETL